MSAISLSEQISRPLPAQPSLSRPVSAMVTVLATVRRNLQVAVRYLPNLLGSLAEMAIRAAFFLILANTVAYSSKETEGVVFTGQTLYTFLLGSLVLFIFNRATLWGPINAVTNDLYNGTLEYLYSLPGSRYAYYVGVVLAEVIINQVVFIPLFLLLVFQAHVDLANVAWMLLACLLVLTALTAMGILIALLALLWRQVGSIVSVLSILFELLAGAYMPLSAFPQSIRVFSYFLPFTWGYDLLRYYSFSGRWQTVLPVWQEWAVLGVFAVVFTIVSRRLLGEAEKLAKRQGLHII
jgi:ABC-2 type transport system permease protein